MSTARKVEMRMAELRSRMGPMRDRIQVVTLDIFRQIYEVRVPLIKYGRRKRGRRRMFPPMRKIIINCGS